MPREQINRLTDALTIQDLIDLLMEQPNKELPVVFSHNYGDNWNTLVTPSVTEGSYGLVKYSDYHNSTKREDKDFEGEELHNEELLEEGQHIAFILE